MSKLKQLASQTALYGISTILVRSLNWLITPFHTRVFNENPNEFGIIVELYAYIAFINVVLMYGMETAFFRYASESKEKQNKVFSTALLSLARGEALKAPLAMTGELSLTGMVLPVGGIREKVIAAKRIGIKELILPEDNRKDYQELPDYLQEGMTVNFAKHFDEVARLTFNIRTKSLALKTYLAHKAAAEEFNTQH